MKLKNLLILLFIFFMFSAFFTNVEIVSESVMSSLTFCFTSLISSLFPYMVLTGIITESACIDGILRRISNTVFYKLGICRKYITSIVLGCICGFVVGARSICDTYKKSGCLNDGFSDSVILSSNAGMGFVIGCVGSKIWSDIKFGIFLYIIQILSALALHMLFKEKSSVKNFANNKGGKDKSFLSCLSVSVSSSCNAILSIISFVVFYSLFIDVFTAIFNIRIGGCFYNILYSVLEFSRGSFAVACGSNIAISAFLTGFCIGFGGLCVYSQIISVCDDLPFNKQKYILIKLIQGIICGFFSMIYVNVTKITPKAYENVNAFDAKPLNFTVMLFIILCIVIFLRKISKKIMKKY